MLRLLNKLRTYRWALVGRKKIRQQVREKRSLNQPIKIVLGADYGSPPFPGWISTDLPQFDITKPDHWQYIFDNGAADSLLAEHVFEHLTPQQISAALRLARKHIRKGGVFRIAVPDRNNTNADYQASAKPGGSGAGAHDHKVFLNIDDFNNFASAASFRLIPLEYFDGAGKFHFRDFDLDNGPISRCKRNINFQPSMPGYTSLVVDLEAV